MASLNTRSQSALPSETSKPIVSCPVLLISSSHGALDGGLSSAIAHLTQVECLASGDGRSLLTEFSPTRHVICPALTRTPARRTYRAWPLETPWRQDINL